MKRWRNLILGILFSVIFLWIALRDLGWQAMGEILQNARWGYLLPAFAIWSLGLGLRAIRWRVLLANRPALRPTFHILNIGFLINNTLPFRVGELARAYLIGRRESGISVWAALSTILTERILDMLMVVLMLAAVLPTLAVDQTAITSGLLLGLVAVVGFGLLLVIAHRPDLAHRLLSVALRLLPPLERLKLDSLLDRILDGLQPLSTRWGLLGALLWTGAAWGCSAAGSWVLALALPSLPATPVMRAALTLSVVAASFSIIVPFTLASVGPFEAAAIFALLTAGISREAAATYAFVWHAGVVVTYAVWGGIGMLATGLSFSQIRQGAATLENAPVNPEN
jgi:uncharacterized protein (TIRG00374 family)